MADMERENMAENVRKRFDDLLDHEKQAVDALMEVGDYSIEEALDIVERGDYEFYPDIFELADLACEFVEEGLFGDPEAMGMLVNYIDYEQLGADLHLDGYEVTSLGVVRIL